MAEVTFYHNERADNAQRTGVTVDGVRALEVFTKGDPDLDPSLRWYIDVIHQTSLPLDSPEAVAEWFTNHSAEIRGALEDAAERLESGIDMDSVPWSFERPGPDGSVRVVVSAMRRYAATHVSERLRRFLLQAWPQFDGTLALAS